MKEWLRVCENEDLAKLSTKQLQEKRVCCKHFLDNNFLCYGVSKKVLTPGAVPQEISRLNVSICNLNNIESPINVQFQNLNSTIVDQSDFSSTLNVDPVLDNINDNVCPLTSENANNNLDSETIKRNANVLNKSKSKIKNVKVVNNKQLKLQIEHLTREVKTLKQKLRRTKKRKPAVSKESIIEGSAKYLNDDVLSFLKMQLNHDKQRKWEEDEKQFALGLYYKSPKAYQFLRDNKNFSLPSISLIRKWVNIIDLKAGKNDQLFKQLKIKLESKSTFEKEAVLMWDEMANRPGLEYNLKEDYIEGYHDLSDNFGGRTQEMAKSVLVVMLSGLTHDWKQPLMYFPTSGSVSGKTLKNIILDVLKITEEVGFRIRHMVCDQGSTNQKAIFLLGINKDKPFIEFENRKITFGFDAPHILKCVRNNLIKNNYVINECEISWSALHELRELERAEFCKAAPKLTDRHLNPNNFEKMNVSLAAQVFSNSVYAALMTGSTSGALKDPTTIATANFFKRINDIFDCLNARSSNDANPLRRGLSDKNPKVEECLKDALTWIAKWQVVDKKKTRLFS